MKSTSKFNIPEPYICFLNCFVAIFCVGMAGMALLDDQMTSESEFELAESMSCTFTSLCRARVPMCLVAYAYGLIAISLACCDPFCASEEAHLNVVVELGACSNTVIIDLLECDMNVMMMCSGDSMSRHPPPQDLHKSTGKHVICQFFFHCVLHVHAFGSSCCRPCMLMKNTPSSFHPRFTSHGVPSRHC
jgi:hypothetical protein